MKGKTVIVLAEDNAGHANLITRNLKRAGICNQILHFRDGRATLDFLLRRGNGPHRISGTPYLLLLDIRMPEVDGIEVLRQVKHDPELCKMPVTIVTTTDEPWEVDNCHSLGCNNYIVKPINYERFVKVIRDLSLFLMVVEVPSINGGE